MIMGPSPAVFFAVIPFRLYFFDFLFPIEVSSFVPELDGFTVKVNTGGLCHAQIKSMIKCIVVIGGYLDLACERDKPAFPCIPKELYLLACTSGNHLLAKFKQ